MSTLRALFHALHQRLSFFWPGEILDSSSPSSKGQVSPLSLFQPRRANLFGNTDAQFNNAVQNLPAVKAARERAMLLDLQ